MAHKRPARKTIRGTRIRRTRAAGLLAAIAAFAVALGYQSLASSPSQAASPVHVVRTEHRGGPRNAAGVPNRPTVLDQGIPGVSNLDPALLGALRRAAADALHDGVEMVVTSGRRSPEHQAQLLRDAISKYGSAREAARWVATPDTSPHVSGDAVDIGPSDAAAWLSDHGAKYGLCQIYGNEPWHYELRPHAAARGCPPIYADPTHDPRMRQ